MDKKMLVWGGILIAAIVVVFVSLAYFNTQNEDLSDIANWKSYKNETYGYEVKYPPDWNIEIDDSVRFPNSRVIFLKGGSDKNNDFWFTIAVVDKSVVNDRMINDALNGSEFLEYLVIEDVVVAKQQAKKKILKRQGDDLDTIKSISYEFLKDGHLFSLVTNHYGDSDGMGEKIISTFTFTE